LTGAAHARVRHRIVLHAPVVDEHTVRFSWAVDPPTALYQRTSFELRFPSSIDLGRVPDSLWWRLALLCLHPHWPLLRPCQVVIPDALSPDETESWLRLTDAAVATLEAQAGGGDTTRTIELISSGPSLSRPDHGPNGGGVVSCFSSGRDSLVQAGLLAELGEHPTLVTVTAPLPGSYDHQTARRREVLGQIEKRGPFEHVEVVSDLRASWDNGFAARYGVGVTELTDTLLYLAAALAVAAARGARLVLIASEADVQESIKLAGQVVQHAHFMYSAATLRALSALFGSFAIGSLTSSLHQFQVQRLLAERYPELRDLQCSCWLVGPEEAACSRCEKCLITALSLVTSDVSPAAAGIDLLTLLEACEQREVGKPWLSTIATPPHEEYLRTREAHVTRCLVAITTDQMSALIDNADPRAAGALASYQRLRDQALAAEVEPEPGFNADYLELVDESVRDGLRSILDEHFLPAPPQTYADQLRNAVALSDWIAAPLRAGARPRARARTFSPRANGRPGAADAAIEASRRALLDEIGDPPDLTWIRGIGNWGDELIWAGTRALLEDRIYREVGLEGLCEASGHTALLAGDGAFCREYHEIMPRALAVIELRFERVIVMPSSFDPGEDTVRDALSRTRATVFAREPSSLAKIESLCDARLAHDCAFFFDFERYRRPGQGTLNAFRTDPEASYERPPPPADNDDISMTAPDLDGWLETIAGHELIRTDRTHVMIAAAMLGKRVEFAPNSYHKVASLAEYALRDFPVRRLRPPAGRQGPRPEPTRRARRGPARVTAVIVTRDRTELALRAVDSLHSESTAVDILVVDSNSSPEHATALSGALASSPGVRVQRFDHNVGRPGGYRAALERAETEFVLLLDDDAQLQPGAVDALVGELDREPDAAAVTATVVFPDQTVHHSGGRLWVSPEVVECELTGAGQQLADSTLAPSGPTDWVPPTAVMVRRSLLEEFPLDAEMRGFLEHEEWCYRVSLGRRGSFRRSREAVAMHDFIPAPAYVSDRDFAARSLEAELLAANAHFYERHRRLLGSGLRELAPGLELADGSLDVGSARLLVELMLNKGVDRTFMDWMNGDLDALLRAGEFATAFAERTELAHRLADQAEQLAFLQERHATLDRIERGGWWRLRGRLLPLLRAVRWLQRRAERLR
jgi:glycosyltransferase involved in cell wall biosynthesis